MFDSVTIKNILFLDIETVPQHPAYDGLNDDWKELWTAKAKTKMRDNDTPESYYKSAGIFAEFGKIVCISAGCFDTTDDVMKFKMKSFYGDDEQNILLWGGDTQRAKRIREQQAQKNALHGFRSPFCGPPGPRRSPAPPALPGRV